MDIFVSYSKKDQEQAYRIVDDLAAAGFEVWIDRSLEVGDEWEKTIEHELQEATDVVIILSENSLKSKWVMHEGSMAYALRKNLFPVLIDEIKPDDLPIWASKIQYQLFYGVEYQKALQKLMQRLSPVDQLRKLLIKQYEIFTRTQVLPSVEFMMSVESSLMESPVQDARVISVLLLAALKNGLEVDFWVGLAQKNKVNVFDLLNDHLQDDDFRFRKSAIHALRLVATSQEVDIFLKFLEDPYPQVRMEAVRALWRYPEMQQKIPEMLIFERYIPAGEFEMGIDEFPSSGEHGRPISEFDRLGFAEYPAHDVFTDACFMDTYPVTNEDYLRFLLDTKPNAVKTKRFSAEIVGREQLAVINVGWDDAHEYARWAGKRLPTEAEWEKAARGPRAFLFPWGNRFDVSRAHTEESGIKSLKPVTSYSPQGHSTYGVACMSGNVWEWVLDWYQEDYYRRSDSCNNPSGPSQGDCKILRGGSYKEAAQNSNCFRRIGLLPTRMGDDIGFRCVFTEEEL